MLAGAHLESEVAGMRGARERVWRRASDIEEDQRAPGGQPLKTGVRRMTQGPAGGLVALQRRLDGRLICFAAAMEHPQGAIAQAEKTQHGRHAVQRASQSRLDLAI